jgi:hypothetical protein
MERKMAYSDILKLKKEEDHIEEKVFIKNLVVGSDIFALDLFHHLNSKEPGSVKILSDEPIDEENFKLLGPSLVRGEESIQLLRELGIEGETSHSVFYKDMKFHKFGSRTKPMKMLWGEEKFAEDHLKLSPEQILPSLGEEGLVEKLKENSFEMMISSIEKTVPEELIDRAFWKVHCTNGTVVECENLFWGETPARFYKAYQTKSELTENFVAFCESTQTPCALYVHINFEKPLTENKETYFFPLSFTHDWGHFIGEIESKGEGQEARFLTFIDKEESSEEDISRKIRLLKKNFEKNFEKFKGNNYREYVVLKENAYCPKIDDSLLAENKDLQENLTFFSFNAPFVGPLTQQSNFEDSWKTSSLIARAALIQSVVKAL